MSLFSSSSKQTTTGTTSPTNPKPVTDSIIDFTKIINSLGNRDPRQYVTGPSYLQNAAFSMGAGIANRYGVNAGSGFRPQTSGQPIGSIGGGGGTLYGAAGVVPEQQYDYAGYVNSNPDIRQHYQSTIVNPKTQAQLISVGADYDNDGRISEEEFGRYHYGAHGQGEGRSIPQVGGAQGGASVGRPGNINGLVDVGGGRMMQGGDGQPMVQAGPNLAAPGYGYEAATMQGNPVSQYQDAAAMTRNAGMAGPNLAQMAGLGPATMYNASGQAQTGTYNPSGPAATQGYAAANAGSQGYNASGPAGSQGYGVTDAGSQGYNAAGAANVGGYGAQNASARGYTADTISDDQRVQIDPVSRARASQGIQFSQPYENRYTDQVVDTTLAGFDEYAGRQRAAEAAQAAGNNAFGGSRFGVQRAITEEQIARERASQEAGLRFGAQDRAFGLGMQDAGTASQVSMANAAAANQRAQAQAAMDQQGLFANMDARNQAGAFGADASNRASMFNADSANQASQFGANARNMAAMDAVGRQDAAAQFGAGAANTAALTNAAAQNQAGMFGADAANRSALDFAGRSDAAGQFGAGAANTAAMYNAGSQNQASQFGADAFNRAGLDFAGRSDAAGALGANARNAASMDAASRMDQASQFNAGSQNQFDLTRFGAANDMSRFNAGQGDTALARQLAAGGQLGALAGDMANNERADLTMLAQLGGQERDINQQAATADLRLMELMAQLYGTMPYQLFQGENSTGTQTRKFTPSGLDSANSLLDFGSKVAGIFG
jgi:hypothetical protein